MGHSGYSWKPNTNNTNEDESCNAAPLESAMKRKTLKFALIWDLSGGLTVLASVVSGWGKKVEVGGEAEEAGGGRRSAGGEERRRVGVRFRNATFSPFPLPYCCNPHGIALWIMYLFIHSFQLHITSRRKLIITIDPNLSKPSSSQRGEQSDYLAFFFLLRRHKCWAHNHYIFQLCGGRRSGCAFDTCSRK